MKLFLLICFGCFVLQSARSQTSNVVNQTISIAGSTESVTANGNTYTVQQTIGQSGVIGTFSSGDNTVRQGFIQPNVMDAVLSNKVPITLESQIFPNPFQNSISVTLKNNIEEKITVKLYDVLGRQVFNKNYWNNQQFNVDLHHLSSGRYIINVITAQKQFVGKIVKK